MMCCMVQAGGGDVSSTAAVLVPKAANTSIGQSAEHGDERRKRAEHLAKFAVGKQVNLPKLDPKAVANVDESNARLEGMQFNFGFGSG